MSLKDYLGTIADAIRTKKESEEPINAQNFPEEILSIESSASSNTLNIFCQLEEPSVKNGIWLQTDKPMEKVIFDDKITAKENWDTITQYEPIPASFSDDSDTATSVGTDIYLFGLGGSNNQAYKYDTINNSYTEIANMGYNFLRGSATSVGTDIYLFGGYNSLRSCYKYDTLTDSYTKMTDIPYDFYYGYAIAIGTDIYLIGGYSSDAYYRNGSITCYRYDTLNDSYTKMKDLPYYVISTETAVTSVGTDIYLIGGYYSSRVSYLKYCYKYDTLTGESTSMYALSSASRDIYGCSATSVGTDIYLFGSGDKYYKTSCYKYDTLTDKLTYMPSIPYTTSECLAINMNDNKIYLLDGDKVSAFITNNKEYDDNSVVISQGVLKYATELVPNENNMLYYFYNVWHYTKETGLNNSIPTYYGNGTEWIKIK